MVSETTLEERVREAMACGDFADVEDAVIALVKSERAEARAEQRKEDAAAVCELCRDNHPCPKSTAGQFLHGHDDGFFYVCPASAIHERAHEAQKEAERENR